MTTPVIAPPEAQPSATFDTPYTDSPTSLSGEPPQTESMARPFRLGLVGFGAAVGLFVRLLAANNFGDLDSRTAMLGAALTSGLIGLGLLLMASERDRFGPPLAWISAITALAWAALNWISPPFAASVTVWSKPDQAVLAVLGLGNGLLLAGIVTLAFVRRHPTLSVGATTMGSVFALAANTLFLRDEWPAIVALGAAFALILLAWDRSPRQELAYTRPEASPRVSRAALSFISVALCGTAIQLWTSRTDIPRSIPAVIVCALLIVGAFVTLVGVRREIEQRETTLSEWTSWAREIRTNDFRAEMQNFESDTSAEVLAVDSAGEAPRKLSFPNLSIPDEPVTATPPATVMPDVVPDTSSAMPAFADPLSTITPDVAEVIPDVSLVADNAPIDQAPDPVIADPVIADPVIPMPIIADPVIADPVVPDPVMSDPMWADPEPLPRLDTPVASGASEITGAEADTSGGVFSSLLASTTPEPASGVKLANLDKLGGWLSSPIAATRVKPLLVAIEAMTLNEFESLPAFDAAMATEEIGSFLADTMPDADLVAWIDGPYFIVAHTSKPDAERTALNNSVRKSLKGTNGVLAFLRPGPDATLDDMVNEAVSGLLQARQAEERAAGR